MGRRLLFRNLPSFAKRRMEDLIFLRTRSQRVGTKCKRTPEAKTSRWKAGCLLTHIHTKISQSVSQSVSQLVRSSDDGPHFSPRRKRANPYAHIKLQYTWIRRDKPLSLEMKFINPCWKKINHKYSCDHRHGNIFYKPTFNQRDKYIYVKYLLLFVRHNYTLSVWGVAFLPQYISTFIHIKFTIYLESKRQTDIFNSWWKKNKP